MTIARTKRESVFQSAPIKVRTLEENSHILVLTHKLEPDQSCGALLLPWHWWLSSYAVHWQQARRRPKVRPWCRLRSASYMHAHVRTCSSPNHDYAQVLLAESVCRLLLHPLSPGSRIGRARNRSIRHRRRQQRLQRRSRPTGRPCTLLQSFVVNYVYSLRSI